ncbi:MAG: InlB B-repeat-containing protein [Acutalibacteraceae bacterium]
MKKTTKMTIAILLTIIMVFGSFGAGNSNLFFKLFEIKASGVQAGIFLWPVPSSYSLSQGYSSSHKAIDIQKCANQNVIASYSGVVYKLDSGTNSSSSTDSSYGTSMIIKHNINGSVYYTHYAHMVKDSIPQRLRTIGASVSQGEIIGKVGNTGNVSGSSGYHLHFSIADSTGVWNGRFNNTPTDSRHNINSSSGVSYRYSIEHEHDFSVYLYYWAKHPHYNDYKCKYCDAKQENRNETNYVASCELCNHTHSYTATSASSATCESGGYTTYNCSCGDSYTTYTNALGHNYSILSYNENAHPHYAVYKCSRCSSTKRTSETGYLKSCIDCIFSGKPVLTVTPGTSKTETILLSSVVNGAEYYEYNIKTYYGDEKVLFRYSDEGEPVSVILDSGKYKAYVVIYDRLASYTLKSDEVIFTVDGVSEEISTTAFQNGYSIYFNANGGYGAPSSQSGKTSYTIPPTTPTRNGYSFLGWSKNSSASSASYKGGDFIYLENDTTLYAVWEKDEISEETTTAIRNGYSIYFNANGGSGAPSAQSGKTSYTIPSTTPTRSGYTFLGWSENSSAISAGYKPGDTIVLSTDTTLYAVWQKAEEPTTSPSNTCPNCGEEFTSEEEYNEHISNCDSNNGNNNNSGVSLFGLILAFFASIISFIGMVLMFPLLLF